MKRLSAYQLACGYVEAWRFVRATEEPIELRLWKEHGTYHVRAL